ncbi:MAG: hypothetical protein ACRDMX_13955 [Solirubrobacteraceae bacterium]
MSRLDLIRGAWGALLLAAPGRAVSLVPGARSSPATCWVARALGGRQLLQAGLSAAGVRAVRGAWWIDGAHSASMVALALAAPGPTDRRRLAGADAAVAASFAVATAVAGR